MLQTYSGDTCGSKRSHSEVDANMLASQFFSMGHIFPDPTYCDRGNTQVVWTAGLFGLVEFEAWENFDEIWHDGMESFRKLSEAQKATAKLLLDSARAIIASDNREDEKIRKLQRKRKRGARRLYRDYASISAIVSNVVSAIENLLREDVVECRNDYFVQCEKECRVSSEFITLDSGEKVHFVLPQSLISDVGVVVRDLEAMDVLQGPTDGTESESESENGRRIMPVCHFEMKGPTLELAGVQQTRKVEAVINRISGPSETTADCARASTGDANGNQSLSNESIDAEPSRAHSLRASSKRINKEEVVSEESKQHEGSVEASPSKPYTAGEVAESFNFMFSNQKFLDTTDKLGGPIRDSIYRVAQVVISAVLSLGGCAYLYNFESGIAFNVVGVRNEKLVIRVTGVMMCDGPLNNISAMYAMAKYCVNENFEGTNTAGVLDRLRSNALSVGINAVIMKHPTPESSHEEYSPANDEDNEYSQGDNSCGASERHGARRTNSNHKNDSVDVSCDDLCVDAALLRTKAELTTSGSEISSPYITSNTEWINDSFESDLKSMFARNAGVLGSGASGIVLKGYFRNVKVAIKTAFDNNETGSAILRGEIRTFTQLYKQRSPLLGTVLPKLILAWDRPCVSSLYSTMTFLITEFVGHGLVRDKEGRLWVGDSPDSLELVHPSEERLICSSAIDGLRQLRENGLLHGDVALRNLRAQRIENRYGIQWSTWWVDLGLSMKISSQQHIYMYDVEVMDIKSLFLNSDTMKAEEHGMFLKPFCAHLF